MNLIETANFKLGFYTEQRFDYQGEPCEHLQLEGTDNYDGEFLVFNPTPEIVDELIEVLKVAADYLRGRKVG